MFYLLVEKKKPFSFLVEDFNAYRLCTFWSLVEAEKKIMFCAVKWPFYVDEFASVHDQCSFDV